MLFNSHVFIFLFLPVTLLGFYRLARINRHWAAIWLTLCSLFFYGWWNPQFLGLLLGSIIFNYIAGAKLANSPPLQAKWLLLAALAANLGLLGYFKYAGFFLENLNLLTGTTFKTSNFFLPLGISFFTFTQIAFMVDTYQGKVRERNFVHYTLFVTYFPHLIAGPVLHHKEMMPQFAKPATYQFDYRNIMIGLVVFFMGLFKKTVLADGLAGYVNPVFSHAGSLSFMEAWGGALSYSLQLYFDFSGYSDMAIGLSRLFGIHLPLNFHSPYQSVNIIEFWRRWHMTLSRFLRDYLYIPLGGSRKGPVRRYFNLLLTMLLGGFWHGAGWTFVVWGGLHGGYLIVNHGWQSLRRALGQDPARPLSKPMRLAATLLTFLCVVVGWVVFRADSLTAAWHMLLSMSGLNGMEVPQTWLSKWGAFGEFLTAHGIAAIDRTAIINGSAFGWILAGLVIVWGTPNTQQIMALEPFKPAPATPIRLRWQPSWAWLMVNVITAVAALLFISRLSEFIYFQF